MKNIICKLASGETKELKVRLALSLIAKGEAIAVDFGGDSDAPNQPETMEGVNVARRGRPRKGE